MFERFLKSKFYTKSKSAIKMTKIRIEIIKRMRDAMQKFLKNDIADLLKIGSDIDAYGRVEALWNDMNMSICYDFVEQFCNKISSNLNQMNKQKECPDECREAVCSLTYAAARFGDLPELRVLRHLFLERYGTSLECYANKEFVNKFNLKHPSKDMKLQLMVDIAAQSGLKWDVAKSLEQKLFKQSISGQEYNKNGSDDVDKNAPENTDSVQIMGNEIADHNHEKDSVINASPKRKPFDDVDIKIHSHYNEIENPDTKMQCFSGKDGSIDEAKSKKPESIKKDKKSLPKKGYISEPENSEKPEEEEEDAVENIMDKFLLYYSTKKHSNNNSNDTRSMSFPVEPSRVDNDDSRGHVRTSSLQPEMLPSTGGHVHPKLPNDYDDFVARLAAVRSSM